MAGTERRRFKRFLMEDQSFVAFRPDFTRLGKIKDMSEGGLGCEYITYQDAEKNVPVSEVDIFHSRKELHLAKIPCRMVYDIPMNEAEEKKDYEMIRRRCGLEFAELSEDQATLIRDFMNMHTAGVAQ